MHPFAPAGTRDLRQRILDLKAEQNALILAHNYQMPEIQDIADLIGDSLALSQQAAEAGAEVIVFCGVKFMAESAKILSPGKTILHPDEGSVCPMAAMVDAETVRLLRAEHPDAAVVAYVNTTAEVKAEVDICCTSANAVKTIERLPERDIVFIPDMNLGLYVRRLVPGKNIILYPGYCPTHNDITLRQVLDIKTAHPGAEIMAHPESIPEVLDHADGVFSTEGMIRYSLDSPAREFIVVTEREMTYRLAMEARKAGLDKVYYPIPTAICPNMKRITLEKVLRSLETSSPAIHLPPDIVQRARKPLDRMLEIGR